MAACCEHVASRTLPRGSLRLIFKTGAIHRRFFWVKNGAEPRENPQRRWGAKPPLFFEGFARLCTVFNPDKSAIYGPSLKNQT